MQIYYEKPNVVVGWDEKIGYAYIRYKDFIYGEEFKVALGQLLRVLKEKKGEKRLGNLEKARIITQDDEKWLSEVWMPQARAAGLKYTAYVLPRSEKAKASLGNIQTGVSNTTTVNYFESEEAAREWLRGL